MLKAREGSMQNQDARRTIFIGDVHGCVDELQALLRKLGATRDDRIIFVGDLVAKGPDSQGVVALARELCAEGVLGNHDDAVLRYRRAMKGGPEPRLKPGHLAVARSLSEDDWRWLEVLPLLLELPEKNVAVVHAGIVPGVPLAEQSREVLLTIRTLRADGTGSSRIDDGELWAVRYTGPTQIVFGHNAITGLQRTQFATGIDTGCVYGRELTALVLPDRKLVRVRARRVYQEIDN
jgi:hypothetical protein